MNVSQFAFKTVSHVMISPNPDNNLYPLAHSLIFKALPGRSLRDLRFHVQSVTFIIKTTKASLWKVYKPALKV